jgi:hypothetical protein
MAQFFKMQGLTQKTNEGMFLGSAIHYGLELRFQDLKMWAPDDVPDVSEAIEGAGNYIETLGNISKYLPDSADKTIDDFDLDSSIPELIEKAKEIVEDTINNFPEELIDLLDTCEIVGVEDRLSVQIPLQTDTERLDNETDDEYIERTTEYVNVAGRSDLTLADHENKILYIIDWKTSKTLSKTMSISEKTQNTTYVMGYVANEQYADYTKYGCIVRIMTKKRVKDIHYANLFLSLKITEQMTEFVKSNLVYNYLQLQQLQEGMIPTYGGLFSMYGCDGCGFKEMCEAYKAFNMEE